MAEPPKPPSPSKHPSPPKPTAKGKEPIVNTDINMPSSQTGPVKEPQVKVLYKEDKNLPNKGKLWSPLMDEKIGCTLPASATENYHLSDKISQGGSIKFNKEMILNEHINKTLYASGTSRLPVFKELCREKEEAHTADTTEAGTREEGNRGDELTEEGEHADNRNRDNRGRGACRSNRSRNNRGRGGGGRSSNRSRNNRGSGAGRDNRGK